MFKMIKKSVKLGMLEALIETYGNNGITKADLLDAVKTLLDNDWLTEEESFKYTQQILSL